jgi:asparagine synthase (glutamine-hydrolysing)
MIGYAALFWPVDDEHAGGNADRIAATLAEAGWRIEVEKPGVLILLRGEPHRPVVQLIGEDTIVLGHIFDRSETNEGRTALLRHPVAVAPFDAKCQYWCNRGWGAYVAIRHAPGFDDIELFRDPMGMLDCTYWTHRRLRLITSVPEALIAQGPPHTLAIDWPRVAALLHDPSSAGDALPILGVEQILPGDRVRVSGAHRETDRIWSPAHVAQRAAPTNAAATLPRLVDACVAAWCSLSQSAVGELSGGLDSAIVASAVSRLPASPVLRWFNYHPIDVAGDERRYAHAVADRLGLELFTELRDQAVVDEAFVSAAPLALRPPIGSLGLFHDAQLALQGEALGADMLLTGQGGDALFFQTASPLIAAGLSIGPRHWRATVSTLGDLALWGDRTIWPGLGALLRHRLSRRAPALPLTTNPLVHPAALAGAPDPGPEQWIGDTSALLPAKRLQIRDLAAVRAVFGASRCSSAMRVVHPLLSQPLVEHVLPIPVLALTQARRDRALARDAWRDRLPELVIYRRGKGSISAFLGRMMAASLSFLRPYLLDGILGSRGIIDRHRLDTWLDLDHLMRTNCYTEIAFILIVEHWARGWTARLNEATHGMVRPPDGAAPPRWPSNQANTRA